MKNFKLLTKTSFRLLALLLCLAASVPQLQADVTIFVRGTAPHIYVFNTNGTAPTDGSTNWPGVQMSQSTTSADGTTWYYVNYEGLNSCSIIFDNGNGGTSNQTWDITGVSGTKYYYSNGSNYYLDLTSVKDKTAYAFFENSSNWSGNLYAHCWNGTYSTNWNGDQMTFVGGTNGGRSVYAWSTNAGTPGMIIFNNGSSQTGDLTFHNGYYYYNNGNSTNSNYANLSFPTLPVVVADTYVVAGPSSIFGSNWDGSASANTMTEGNDGNYTLTLNNVSLTASTSYEYKVVKNGSQWIPSGDNLTFNVPLNGSYNITFTFDPSTNTCNVTYSLQTATGGETYTVAGSNTTILGSSWDQTDSNNDMTLVNGVYQLTFNNVVLSDNNPSCEFRVVVNHSWVTAYPSGNASVSGFNGSGTYDIVFTYDPSDNSITGVATKHIAYYVVGDNALIGHDWAIANDTQMTESSGTYTWSKSGIHLTAGDYNLKVKDNNGTWYGDSNNDNVTVNADVNGTYDLSVSFDPSTGIVTATLTRTAADPVYDIYVRYTGSEDVQNVYMHVWDTNGDKTSWPGMSLSSMTSTVINGHTYYHVTISSTDQTLGLLFDENGNSGTQTADLTANPGDNYFTYGGGSTVSGPNASADAPTVFYVVGSDTNIFPNEWSMGAGTAMTNNQDGTYTWTSQVHLTPGVNYEYKVRGDDNSWHPDGGNNQTFNVNVPGTYTLTVTYDSNTGTVTATTTLIAADPISAVYIIGYANTQQWAANAGIQMEYDNETGYFTLKNVVLTAMSHFALATHLGSNNEDWTTLNANRLSSDGDSNWLVNDYWLDEDEDRWMPTMDYTSENHNWYVEQSGAYDFYFNPTNRQLMIKKSYGKMYISYGVGWTYENNSVEMSTVDGNIYQATITLTQGDYFLFSTELSDASAWGATENGYIINDLMVGFAQELIENRANNYHFTGATGKYIVVVNKEKGTVILRRAADATVTKIFLEKTSNVVLDPVGGTYNNQPVANKRGGIYAWNKLNLQNVGHPYDYSLNNGPTNYTYDGEVGNGYGGDNYLKDLPDTTTLDNKQWYAWSVANSICEFYFIRTNKDDKKSQKIIRRSGEIWLTWIDEKATTNCQDDAVLCDSLYEVTRDYYDVSAGGVSDCATMLEDHYYVYYTNTTGWDSVYCYAWYEAGNEVIRFTDEYPGNKCTFVGYDENGFEIWCFDFGLMEDFHAQYGDIIPTGVIFDNGKGGAEQGAEGDKVREQTGDLVFDNGACYDYLGMIYLGNSLNGIINTGIVNGPKYTVEDDLIGVYYDENAVTRIIETDTNGNPIIDEQTGQPRHIDVVGALYAKDIENYSAKSMQPEGTTDYVYDICAHPVGGNYTGGSQIQLERTYYDQSNWVKIVLSPNFDNEHIESTDVTYDREKFDNLNYELAAQVDGGYLRQYVDKIIPGGSMSGNLASNVNPQMHITNIAQPITLSEPYKKNVYVTGHFNDSVVFSYVHQDWSPGIYQGVHKTVPVLETDENNNTFVDHMWVSPELYKMFYVAPKPQEIAFITWAVFDHPDKNVGDPNYESEPSVPGAFYAPMNWDRTGQLSNGTDPNAPYGETYGPYSNGFMQYGAFQVNWSLFEGMEADDSDNPTNRSQDPWYRIFKPGQAYKILALIRYAHDDKGNIEYKPGVYKGVTIDNEYDGYNNGYNNEDDGNHVANAPRRYDNMDPVPYNPEVLADSKFIVFPLLGSNSESEDGSSIGNVTVVKEVVTPRTAKSVRYYNLMGVESDKPFDGLNIVVTTYSDGSRSSKKILR